jgi:hypothetical protein
MEAVTAFDTLRQTLNNFITLFQGRGFNATEGAAIHFADNNILRYVYQTTGKVTGVGRFKGRIRQTLTGTVRGDKELLYRQSFKEV